MLSHQNLRKDASACEGASSASTKKMVAAEIRSGRGGGGAKELAIQVATTQSTTGIGGTGIGATG